MIAGFFVFIKHHFIHRIATKKMQIRCLNPGYTAYMLAESKKALIADGKSPAEIAVNMPSLKQQWTTGGQMLQALVGQTVCGTVISLVMGLFIKNKK